MTSDAAPALCEGCGFALHPDNLVPGDDPADRQRYRSMKLGVLLIANVRARAR